MLATETVFGGYIIIRDRLLWELKLFLFHWIEMKLAHKITVCVSGLEIKLTLSYLNTAKISNFEIPQLWWARSPIHIMIYEITRSTSLSYLSIKSWPSSCIDDSDKPPSKTRHEATNARLIYTACKAFCTAQRSCSAFRGRTAAALIWLLILGQMCDV